MFFFPFMFPAHFVRRILNHSTFNTQITHKNAGVSVNHGPQQNHMKIYLIVPYNDTSCTKVPSLAIYRNDLLPIEQCYIAVVGTYQNYRKFSSILSSSGQNVSMWMGNCRCKRGGHMKIRRTDCVDWTDFPRERKSESGRARAREKETDRAKRQSIMRVLFPNSNSDSH